MAGQAKRPRPRLVVFLNGIRVYGQQRQRWLGRASLSAGRYWYDPVSGLYGPDCGPSEGTIEAYLPFGVPALNASGVVSSTRINGRCICPLESQSLGRGRILEPGHYRLGQDGVLSRVTSVWHRVLTPRRRPRLAERLDRHTPHHMERRWRP
jgi:hypothetical protein